MKRKTNISKPQEFITTNIDVDSAIIQCIDKIGAKNTVLRILGYCLYESLQKSSFPSVLLATSQDEDMADTSCALLYLKRNWKDCSKKGMERIEEIIKKKEIEGMERIEEIMKKRK